MITTALATTTPAIQVAPGDSTKPVVTQTAPAQSSAPTRDEHKPVAAATGTIPAAEIKLTGDTPKKATGDDPKPAKKPGFSRKGTGFVYWGYNRAYYGNSDITFRGQGSNFTLQNVAAKDRPGFTDAKGAANYILTSPLTVPQYNVRGGYYIDDKHSVSIGWDHMKYVAVNGQQTSITGTISPEASARHAGTYNNQSISMGRPGDIVNNYEHTNGFNLLDVEFGRTETILASKNGKHALSVNGTVGAGVMIPHTDATMFDFDNTERFHLSGYGVSAGVGVRADIFKYAFIEGRVKAGYTHMNDILTVPGIKAEQSITYVQPMIVAGINIPIKTK